MGVVDATPFYSVGTTFRNNTTIVKFNEFRYFTKVTSVGSYYFGSCTNLKEIVLPNSLISFEGLTFAGTGIKSITIPINVVSIKQYSFAGMGQCETIICMPTTAPTIVSGNPWAWGGANNCIGYQTRNAGTNKIYIPKGSTGYDASGWQTLTGANYGFTFVEME